MTALRPMLAVGALVILASPLRAQGDRYATVDVRAGYTLPLSTAKDEFKGQSSFGAGFAIALSNRLHLGPTFDFAHHSVKQADGTVIGGPDDQQYNVFHLFLKASFDALTQNHFTIAVNAGPGLLFFQPNDALKNLGAESDRHFAINGGLTITWWFSDRIGLVASPQADIALSRSSGHIDAFKDKSAMMFPLTGGFRFKI